MNLSPALLFTAVVASQTVDQRSPNNMHFVMGGLMSGHVEYDIDFDTGRFKFNDWNSLGLKQIKSEGALSREAADKLKWQARTAVVAGLENRRCRSEQTKGQIMVPSMDADSQVWITIKGRTNAFPSRPDCWSKAAEKLDQMAEKTLRSASGR